MRRRGEKVGVTLNDGWENVVVLWGGGGGSVPRKARPSEPYL